MGVHAVGVVGNSFNVESLLGSGSGAAIGAAAGITAKAIIGGVGIAAGGGAIALPASLLGIAGAGIGLFAGYSIGDVAHNLLQHVPSFLSYVKAGSLLVVGTMLIIDGCRRILGSEAFKKSWSSFKNGTLYLADIAMRVVCKSVKELSHFWSNSPAGGASAIAGAAAGVTVGTSIGTSIAASGVTVLGSHALGGFALSMGLVSAPVLPAIALAIGCGAGGAALAVGIWKLLGDGSDVNGKQLGYTPRLGLPPPSLA